MSADYSSPYSGARVRIGELSGRTGVSADTLRAWERRYELLRPARSEGGFRLYGGDDERRVRAMRTLIDSGVSAAEAARQVLATAPPSGGGLQPGGPPQTEQTERLRDALQRFDEAEANAILDEALARFTLEGVAERILLPVMREIGEQWEGGELSIAQEHFATGVVRGRLLSLARNWGAGGGPLALLACPPDEQHDLGLIVFGLLLYRLGWRIAYLGQDTPIETISQAARELSPDAIVLAAVAPQPLEAARAGVSKLVKEGRRVLVGGAGASDELAARLGVERLDQDPVAAARELGAAVRM